MRVDRRNPIEPVRPASISGQMPGKKCQGPLFGELGACCIVAGTVVTVEAVVTEVNEHPLPSIKAEGYLQVDGLYIYKMENFGINLIEN